MMHLFKVDGIKDEGVWKRVFYGPDITGRNVYEDTWVPPTKWYLKELVGIIRPRF